MTTSPEMIDICAVSDLTPERGSAALLGDRQVAVFLLDDGSVHAVQQHDPYSGANVIARGLVGTHSMPGEDGEQTVVQTIASPMYKQVWNLDTGAVIDPVGGPDHPLEVYDVQLREGRVLVSPTPRPGTGETVHDSVGATP